MRKIQHILRLGALAATVLFSKNTPSATAANLGTLRGEAAVDQLRKDGNYNSLADAVAAAGYRIETDGASAIARNAANGLQMNFTAEGWQLKSTAKENAWTSNWRLQSFGYGGNQTPAATGDLKTSGNRVELKREAQNLTEWFVNNPAGIEHGFVLQEAPGARVNHAPLRLVMRVDGELIARTDAEGKKLTLSTNDGKKVLRYQKLKVWDANGKNLTARMRSEANGGEVWLEVEDGSAVYPVTIDPTFGSVTKLAASDGAASDRFGTSVAISGDTAIVGAPAAGNVDQGAAYIFVRNGSNWIEQQELTPSDGLKGDWFGWSVAIDGDTVIVGALNYHSRLSSDPDFRLGRAYVFVRNGETWSQQQELSSPEERTENSFGRAVAVDGDTAVILQTTNYLYGPYAIYVFVRSGQSWSLQQKLSVAPTPDYNSSLGYSAAISGDTIVAAGLSGSAYIFVRDGTTWSLQAHTPFLGSLVSGSYGRNPGPVAISGETMIMGYIPNPASEYFGAAAIYVRNGTTWSLQQKLFSSDPEKRDNFGTSVAIEGEKAVVGASLDTITVPTQGSAYVFTRSGTTWSMQDYLVAADGGNDDRIGSSVGINGPNIIVGGVFHYQFNYRDNGAAYIFGGPIVSLSIDIPETHYNPGDTFVATVTVTASSPETLTVTFADPLLQEQPLSGLPTDAILTVDAGEVPPPFQLTPTNPTQSFPVVVTTDKRGQTKLISSLSYSGSAGSSGTLNAVKDILISPLEVTLRAKPLVDGQPIVNMLLDDEGQITDAKGNLVSPKVEVTVTNTSDQSVIASLQGIDPRARDTSDVLGRIAVAGEFPILFGTLAPGQTVTREFALQINQNGRWEFVALVSGAAVGSSQGFDISAHGAPIAVGATYPVEIDLDYLPSSAITNQNNGAFFLQPGSVLGVFASVQNLTSNSTLKFYGMQAEKHLNAFGADLTSDAGRAVDPPFVHDHTLDANSTEILSGKILTDKDGAPSGTAKWVGLERAFLVDNATGEKTAVTADDILIKSTWGGWLGDEATIRVIQDFSRPPAPPPLTGYEKLEAFDVGALEGMGQWTYDAFDAIGGLGRLAGTISADPTLLADAIGNGSRAVWEASELAVTTWKNMSPGQRDEFILSLCDEVLRRNLLFIPDERECEDIAGARTFVQQATYSFFQGFETAYASDNPAAITQEWGRVAGHVSLELITSTFPTPKFTKYTKAAEAVLLADSEALGTALNVQEEFLRAVESGPVSEAITIKHWGVGGENLRNMQDVFRRFGVIGYLRERSPEAFELIDALREAVWKPEAMKPKGLTDLDLLILGDDIPAILGKNGNRLNPKGITPIFMPPPDEIIRARLASQGHQEEVIAAVLSRAKTRRAEFEEFVPLFEAWSRPVATGGGIPVAGNYLDNGVPNPIGIGPNRGFRFERFAEEGKPIFYLPKMQDADGAFRYIAGDIDWVHFSFLDGSPLDSDTAFKLYDAMRRCCGLQHPETITWIRDGQTVFKAKINQIAGYLRGEKALLEVSGATTRAVRIDQRLTRFPTTGRDYLISFEAGLKSRTRATLADIESAFAYFQAKFPDRRLLAPFLWGPKFNYTINNSSNAVLARQASGQPSNRPSFQSFSRSSVRDQSDDSSLDVIEIFNGSQWVTTNVGSLPPTVSLVPTSGLGVDVPAGARVLPIVDLPQLFAAELAGHLETWFTPGQAIVIAPGEATQEVRRIIAGTSLTVDRPLEFSHATGTLVAVVPASLADIIGLTPAPVPVLETPRLLNLSNRARVLNGDNVMIGGLIITGSEPKRVLMRAIGNSIQIDGKPLAGRLADPTLALYDTTGAQIAFNDDWSQTPEAELTEIANSGLQPTDPHEPAMIRTLSPGAYTAIVRGQNESNGIAVVETYDLNPTANSRLANLSARAYVDNGDNLMIGGTIVAPSGAEVVVRGLGPSLNVGGTPVQGRLADPTLRVVNANGEIIAENDNWQDQATGISAIPSEMTPPDPAEAALRLTLPAGGTTILLRGKDNTTGIGLMEIYDISPAP